LALSDITNTSLIKHTDVQTEVTIK